MGLTGRACDECPYEVNAPRTVEGQAAAGIIRHPGTWLRAGMTGMETGLDMAALAYRLDRDVDAHAVRLLLTTPAEDDAERGGKLSPELAALAAMAERRKTRRDGDDEV